MNEKKGSIEAWLFGGFFLLLLSFFDLFRNISINIEPSW